MPWCPDMMKIDGGSDASQVFRLVVGAMPCVARKCYFSTPYLRETSATFIPREPPPVWWLHCLNHLRSFVILPVRTVFALTRATRLLFRKKRRASSRTLANHIARDTLVQHARASLPT